MVTQVLDDLKLKASDIVGKCFDGASNMSGVKKGLAARMKECSPDSIYVHCYAHLLNLAIQATITNVQPLRNTLGTIQNLYNFLEGSPKRHAILHDIEVEGKPMMHSLKSQSATRWVCHYEAVKVIHDELERIVKALHLLSDDKDAKTCCDSRALLVAICNGSFVLGLCILRVILLNTSSLSRYLQSKDLDVLTAKKSADLTLTVLKKCRDDENFDLIWKKYESLANELKQWVQGTEFAVKEIRMPRRKPSRRHQALVGETVEDITTQDPVTHHKVETYFAALDRVIFELESRFQGNDQRILCSLGEITLSQEPSQESFRQVSEFYKIDRELLQAEFAIFKTFRAESADKLNFSKATDVYEALHKSHLLPMLPQLSHVIKIFTVISATSCTAERAFSGLRRMKTYLRNTMGQQRLTDLAVINIERYYSNRVIENDKLQKLFGIQQAFELRVP